MHLPLLERRTPELETCAFCPKLSRAVCPVSNADGKETTTPWGKMSAAYLLARGGVEATPDQAWPPWACTGCFACKQACELGNDVAGTLLDARADLHANGLSPEPAKRVIAEHRDKTAASDRALGEAMERARARGAKLDEHAPDRLLVGCLGARTSNAADDVAGDTIVATQALLGAPISVARACCGAPLRLAGDREGFVAEARAFVASLEGVRRLVVADAGCAHTLLRRYEEVGVTLPKGLVVEHLVELAARELPRIPAIALEGPVRYHDACHLGRGLGLYDPPRAVLAAILGRSPDEFARRREWATCSGGGGLVPSTGGDVAKTIAAARVAQHVEEGGGAIVTTCAGSRKLLGRDGTPVHDLASLLARALTRDRR